MSGGAGPYRDLVREASHLLWMVTAEGLIDAEQGWLPYTGQSRAEVKGWGWLTAVHPDDRAWVRQEWTQALDAGDRYESIHRLRRADGAYRTFLVRAIPLPAPAGAVHDPGSAGILPVPVPGSAGILPVPGRSPESAGRGRNLLV